VTKLEGAKSLDLLRGPVAAIVATQSLLIKEKN